MTIEELQREYEAITKSSEEIDKEIKKQEEIARQAQAREELQKKLDKIKEEYEEKQKKLDDLKKENERKASMKQTGSSQPQQGATQVANQPQQGAAQVANQPQQGAAQVANQPQQGIPVPAVPYNYNNFNYNNVNYYTPEQRINQQRNINVESLKKGKQVGRAIKKICIGTAASLGTLLLYGGTPFAIPVGVLAGAMTSVKKQKELDDAESEIEGNIWANTARYNMPEYANNKNQLQERINSGNIEKKVIEARKNFRIKRFVKSILPTSVIAGVIATELFSFGLGVPIGVVAGVAKSWGKSESKEKELEDQEAAKVRNDETEKLNFYKNNLQYYQQNPQQSFYQPPIQNQQPINYQSPVQNQQNPQQSFYQPPIQNQQSINYQPPVQNQQNQSPVQNQQNQKKYQSNFKNSSNFVSIESGVSNSVFNNTSNKTY